MSCESAEVITEVDTDSVQETDITILNINVNREIPIDEYVSATLFENTDQMTSVFDCRIKRRGGFSISFPKHSYELDLSEDYPLSNLPSDDDWILNANYIDKTFLRHVLSYELFADMNDHNRSCHTSYIELEVDSTYQGLYVLMEKLDKSSLQINADDIAAMIFKEPHVFRASYDLVVPQKDDNFHQQVFPKIEVDDKTDAIEIVRDFILTSEDEDFSNRVDQIFDIQNIIDWQLLLLISNNGDGILKNFYLYKVDSETPLRVAPWDYDHSFGRDGDNELNLDKRPAVVEKSILFSRLMTVPWYRDQLKQSWEKYNQDDLLSIQGLKDRVAVLNDLISVHAQKNFTLWSVAAPEYYDDNDFESEIDIILEFIDVRHQRLSDYFDSL